jgi:hypothetical protein
MPDYFLFFIQNYASPLGVFLGAITAFLTFVYVTLRNARLGATAELMSIYQEFWTDSFLDARRWIAIDEAYEDLSRVLCRRFEGDNMRHLTKEEYDVLEKLDQFLVMFVRIEHLNKSYGRLDAKSRHVRQFGNYRRGMILSRPELSRYVSENWPILTSHGAWDLKKS